MHERRAIEQDRRLLSTLERLLQIPDGDLGVALSHAADPIAEALGADKVDAFIYDPARDSLVALGVSTQPLSALQRRHGLDVLQVANGGRVAEVLVSGRTYVSGDVQNDPEELRGVRDALKIGSKLGVPLVVGGERRGVLMIACVRPNAFTDEDVRFAEALAHWLGIIAHRAELVQQISRRAQEEGRRAAAEELVTVLAHDLRNYLSPIQLRVGTMRQRAERSGRADDARDAAVALRGIERLSAMVSDLLDVARIDQGLLHLVTQPIELAALARDVAHGLSTETQPVEVLASEDVPVLGDAERLRQCLEKLVANAVKHSPRGSAVTLIVNRRWNDDHDLALVEIHDQGPGVPKEVAPRVFERFVSGSQGTGLGLGLYLAKSIAAAHGGDLTLESSASGSRFVLTLPVANGSFE